MKRRTGRPPKASKDEKIAIVDRFYIENSTDRDSLLGSHGVYRRLSEYAKSLSIPLEAYDFSRDSEVCKHIEKLVRMSAQESSDSSAVLTYEPLDVVALMMTGQEHIQKTIKERESYFLAIHKKAARAIEQYSLVAQQAAQYKAEVEELRRQKAALQEQVEQMVEELRSTKTDVAYLKRIIRKKVEPDCAQQFLAGLKSNEMVIQNVEPFVMKNMKELTSNDKRLQKEAQEEIDIMDLNNLFK